MTRPSIRSAAAATVAVAAVAALAPTMAAQAAPTATRSLTMGHCTRSATVSLQLGSGGAGRVEVGFEVDHSPIGHQWRTVLTHNGTAYYRGTMRAAAPDGTFSVDRVLRNLPGVDRFTGTATDTRTGQVCSMSARWLR